MILYLPLLGHKLVTYTIIFDSCARYQPIKNFLGRGASYFTKNTAR